MIVVGEEEEDDDDDVDERSREVRRRDFRSRSSIFPREERASCAETSFHFGEAWAGGEEVERVSVMGKHLVLSGEEGQESG